MKRLTKHALLLTSLVVAAVLSGCSGYQLRGKVVPGKQSSVQVVSRDDPRFNRRGIDGVEVTVTLDPESLDNKRVGSGETGSKGGFALPVDVMGGGFLEHEVMVAAIKKDFATAKRIMMLPGGNRRLLITLAEGQSTRPQRKGQALEEALQESEPYMEQMK
jgi:hypothetical protein